MVRIISSELTTVGFCLLISPYLCLTESMADTFNTDQFTDYVHPSQLESLMNDLDNFITKQSTANPTFKLWMIYLEMVQVLLLFLRATRENNWELHLSSIRSMLPWFLIELTIAVMEPFTGWKCRLLNTHTLV